MAAPPEPRRGQIWTDPETGQQVFVQQRRTIMGDAFITVMNGTGHFTLPADDFCDRYQFSHRIPPGVRDPFAFVPDQGAIEREARRREKAADTLERQKQRAQRRAELDERVAEMVRMRKQGATLDEVGDYFGVTRERVRQLTRHLVDGSSVVRERAERARAAVAADSDQIMELYRDGIDTRVIARALHHPTTHVRELIAELRSDIDVRDRMAIRPRQKHLTREDWIRWLRRYADEHDGRTPGLVAFRKWRARGRPEPSGVYHVGWGWAEACAAAGLTPNDSLRRNYTRQWTNDQILEWLQRHANERASLPTHDSYTTWAREHDGAPSAGLVRVRFGRWSEAVRQLTDPKGTQ